VDDLEHPREPAPRLVFFDLDGTISRRDTLFGYVAGFVRRHPLRAPRYLAVLPTLAGFALGIRDRGDLKGALLHAVMGGAHRSEIQAWTDEYVPKLIARGVFKEALAAIRKHRDAGDHLVLMTATVDLYVPELSRALGFDAYLCSQVSWKEDRLEGWLASPNMRDEEKASALRRTVAKFPGRRLVGYGNSAPDLPHLKLVDQAILVNASKSLRKAASGLPVEFKYWL
jgi:phosphatidylglycerophosphatase C